MLWSFFFVHFFLLIHIRDSCVSNDVIYKNEDTTQSFMQYSIGKHFFANNLQKNDSFNKLPNFQAPVLNIRIINFLLHESDLAQSQAGKTADIR